MRKTLFISLLLWPSLSILAQKPAWVTDSHLYPKTQYLTGYSENIGTESSEFAAALKASAKSELIENINVTITSLKELYKSERGGVHSDEFVETISSFANADINGLTIKYHYDKNTGTGYALAYADKSEVKGYYKANISFIIQKTESCISDALQFEMDGRKGKSKKTYEEIIPLFNELEFSQSLLIAIEGGEPEGAQIQKTIELRSAIAQAISRLQTAVIVHVISTEANLSRPVQILAPKLKAELSKYGCSFIPVQEGADWLLSIDASTRRGNNVEGLCFAYLDVIISLVERKSGKEIYNNNFTGLKGGALNYEQAGIKAYENGCKQIVDELVKNIEK